MLLQVGDDTIPWNVNLVEPEKDAPLASGIIIKQGQQGFSKKSMTDWEKMDTLQDEDIDFSDCPEVNPEQFVKAIVRKGLKSL